MRKILSIVLSAVITISMFAALPFSAGAVELSDFKYKVLANDTAVISDYKGKDTEVEIPGKIDGHIVSAIGKYCFSFNKTLESVVIPQSVTSIGSGAFEYCTALKKVEIPESVNTIRRHAFDRCENLTDITLPSKIQSIEDYLFTGCKSLKSIEIPEKVNYIGTKAFSYCESLEGISIPDTVRTLGEEAFYQCPSLSSARLSKNITVIPDDAFAGAKALTKISLHKNITKIGDSAFAGSGLEKISIGKNVEKIGENAFEACPNLKSITVDKKNKNYSSKSGVFYNKKKTKLITYPGGKTGKKFTTLKTVTKISYEAFVGNDKLRTVKLSKGLKTIEGNAFYGSRIKKISFPSTLETIGYCAFSRCDYLDNVTIPTSVTEISREAFADCDGLKSLTIKGNSKLVLSSRVFKNCSSLKKVKMPIVKKSLGRTFENCTGLKKVTISKDVKKIYKKDFADCPNLNKITIPATVKSIGGYAIGFINEYDGEYDKNYNLVIECAKDSAAYKYAEQNGFMIKKMK